ncbi:MAG: hypothetical protein J6B04_06660 [Clostridia bacterium]|nr:hypothetical protein [Clostridia bacterium]
MEAIYDIFIGYHGTFDKNGSYQKAKEIADYLEEGGYCVYLHGYKWNKNYPTHKETPWNCTWERVLESKAFLLVVNDNVHVKNGGMLGNDEGEVSQIRKETETFDNLVNRGERNLHDFNIYYCGKLTDEKSFKNFTEALYSPLTAGHNYLLQKHATEQDVFAWLKERNINPSGEAAKPVQPKFSYRAPYDNDFVKVVEGSTFTDVYNRACSVARKSCNNLIIVLDALKEEFIQNYPFEEALKKAKVIMGNKPDNPDEEREIEFSLYHGDYIKYQHEGKTYDGYSYALEELKGKHTSRRSLISLISTQHIYKSGNTQIPSYMLSQFQIRNDVLVISEYFRAIEVKGFLPTNMAETYVMVNRILEQIPDINRIVVAYHCFDAYVSDVPKSSLYIPKMDRNGAQYDITIAIAQSDYDKIIELLTDKLNSKIYNLYSGFEHLRNGIKRIKVANHQELENGLVEIINKCRTLECLYEKSNDPQEEMIKVIAEMITKIIKIFQDGGVNGR